MPLNRAIRSILTLSVMALSVILAGCMEPPVKKTNMNYDPGESWKLVWSDEFDGETIDTNKWNFEKISINRELQTYNDTNAYISNGNCVFLVTRFGNVFISSRLNTVNKFCTVYGKIVARIKVPYGTGLWPAFWMLGTNISSANWPQCGEIDIMEERGGNEGDQIVYGTAHWYADRQHVQFGGTQMLEEPLSKDFHIYELEWDDTYLRWKIDDTEYNTIDISSDTMEAFHKPFYIILNVAVGGMFSRIYSPGGVTAEFPQYMTVDWVRVYKKQ